LPRFANRSSLNSKKKNAMGQAKSN
jgi:hypothetical protein